MTKNGSIIDRARFGYIFDKILLIKAPEIDQWKEEQKDKEGVQENYFQILNLIHSLTKNGIYLLIIRQLRTYIKI